MVLYRTATSPVDIMQCMANVRVILKTAGSVLAATVTVLTALKENPQLSEGVSKALEKIKAAMSSRNPRVRFDAKITAIQACADAVEEEFQRTEEAAEWRRAAAALRMRGDLAWDARSGKARRLAMKAANAETEALLEKMNTRLVELAEQAQRKLAQ